MTKKSFVWSFGNNSNKEIGLKLELKHNAVPRNPIGSQKNMVSINTGYKHSGMVSLEGKVYMAGNNLQQKLGLSWNELNDVRKFSEVENISECPEDPDRKVVGVACGFSHSMALLEDGRVLCWGGSLGDKLGHKIADERTRFKAVEIDNYTYNKANAGPGGFQPIMDVKIM